jgi:hypothetical protein
MRKYLAYETNWFAHTQNRISPTTFPAINTVILVVSRVRSIAQWKR